MAEYKCGDCIHADACEEAETLTGFSRDNPAYCGMFLNAADVAPVRHGKWEWSKDYDGDSILVCSECGRVCHEEDAPYCYCGAKMDGGADHA